VTMAMAPSLPAAGSRFRPASFAVRAGRVYCGSMAITKGVYTITCIATGRVYAGSSSAVRRRWNRHRWALRHGKHTIAAMQADWDEHGEESFRFDLVAEIGDAGQRRLVEQALIDAGWADGRAYNVSPGVVSSTGVPLSPEHRQAISAANRGAPKSAAHRARLSAAHRALWADREITPEYRERMAEMARLRTGHAVSAETRRKVSAAQKGRPLSPEHLAALRAAKAGGGKPLKLTAEQIPEIRRRIAAGESMPSIAAAFGVKPASISDIKHGRSWRHVPEDKECP